MTSEQMYNLAALLIPAVFILAAFWYYLYSALRHRRHYGRAAAILLATLMVAGLLAVTVYLVRR